MGRSWAVFGLAWAVLAPSWGRLGSILGLLGTIWGHLEPSGGELEAILSCLVAETASRSPHVAKTLFFATNFNDFMMPSLAVLGCLGAILGPSWAVLGPSWGRLEAMSSCLVAETASRSPHVAKTLFFATNCNDFMMPSLAVLGCLGAILGPSWAVLSHLGPSWGYLRPAWDHLGAVLGPSRAVVGPSGAILGRLGATPKNLEKRVPGNALFWTPKWPPK